MPCNDGGYRNDVDVVQGLRDRNDKLAQELCRAGALFVRLSDEGAIDYSKVSPPTANEIERFMRKHKEHREHDRKRELDLAKKQLGLTENQIKRIKELGGLPSPQLLQTLVEQECKILAIESCDPFHTDLF